MRFFIERGEIADGAVTLSAEDSAHIGRVLRRRVGDSLSLCDGQGMDYEGVILVTGPAVTVRITGQAPSATEPTVDVTLYAGLSKGERFEFLVQKAVELGARRIVPFTSRYCVVKVDERDRQKKQVRLQKIAVEACKQSLRSRLVEVAPVCTFQQAVEQAGQAQCPLFLYEKENRQSLSALLRQGRGSQTYAVVTGPEGGFSPEEAAYAMETIPSVSVGPRILRCETAPLAALCAILYETSNFDIGE